MDTPGNPRGKQSEPDSGRRHDFSLTQNLDLNVEDMRLGGSREERDAGEEKKGQYLGLERWLSG